KTWVGLALLPLPRERILQSKLRAAVISAIPSVPLWLTAIAFVALRFPHFLVVAVVGSFAGLFLAPAFAAFLTSLPETHEGNLSAYAGLTALVVGGAGCAVVWFVALNTTAGHLPGAIVTIAVAAAGSLLAYQSAVLSLEDRGDE
ncbi:MAG: hypothetical protein B7Z55_17025, partial [Planctomycetales bacterium 12-60-4]